ncbi:MAG: tRNA uridine-5-carboxymethylaminomethyl(34) synthesis GTPase MnmE [Acetobacteraceae bacterium]|nr:tRNA uridine-5-carboxymethylaminomethyl(34) synthesis GTPase MnmE [Acetobacteraceae bacterium]
MAPAMSTPDTIFALATGAGQAAIAVLRISGAQAGALLAALVGKLPEPRRASLRRLRDGAGETLDRAMVLWLPGPGSFTGEDGAELFVHASRAVIGAVADRLVSLGARPAEPGEFSRRAFLNGKLDLLAAEAIADLVAAETLAQARQALRQMEGSLSVLYRSWATRLRHLLAHQEALIDFPDEDLPADVDAGVRAEMLALHNEMAAHLDDHRRGERLREGLVFAITGAPNVGKSSLVNALAERDVAIVSDQPGTTRDALEARIVLGGVPITLVDTAGLREAADAIEAEGIRRALARAADADARLRVVVAGADDAPDPATDLLIANKADLGGTMPPGALVISARTGAGMDALRDRLGEMARALTQAQGPPPLTRARHRAALVEAVARLDAAHDAPWPELRAEDLRLAMRAIGRITGTVGVEDLLDTIFRQFCIGK